MGNKSSGLLKKEDRAFLYFMENSKGRLSIKFGPDKYTHNTKKFNDMLMLGLSYGLAFFSNLLKEKPINEREEYYDKIILTLGAVAHEAFPDVFEYKAKKIVDEETAIKLVEEGFTPSEETEQKVLKLKEELREQIKNSRKLSLTVDEHNQKLLKDLEDTFELYNQVLEYIMLIPKKLTNKNKLELKELDFKPFGILVNIMLKEIEGIKQHMDALYGELIESNNETDK